MKSGELLEAAEEGDVQGVENILSELLSDEWSNWAMGEETAKQLDDADSDSDGKTSLMAAARGAGSGGEHYASILKLLWNGHKKCGTSKICLETKDSKRRWNVFIADFEEEEESRANEVYSAKPSAIPNVSQNPPSVIVINRASEPPTSAATMTPQASQPSAIPNVSQNPASVINRASEPSTSAATMIPQASQPSAIPNVSQNPASVINRASEPSTSAATMIPQASQPSAIPNVSQNSTSVINRASERVSSPNPSPATNRDVANPTKEEDVTVTEGDQFDTYAQATNQPTIAVARSNELSVCRQELNRAREENKRLASEIKKLKQAIRVLTG